MRARWLEPGDEHALEELLLERPVSNLFLIALSDQGLEAASWVGAFEGDRLLGVAAVVGTLVVPSEGAVGCGAALGREIAERVRPSLLVGAREPADGILTALPSPRHRFDQRLYVCEVPPVSSGLPERALADEVEVVADLAEAMNLEDIGRGYPDRDAHLAAVARRIDQGRVFVGREDGRIVFTVNVGTQHALGCQIGGTYVLPDLRGSGRATRGLAPVVRHLLDQHPRVTLHVDEQNLPAVRLYERLGFQRHAPFRLVTWP